MILTKLVLRITVWPLCLVAISLCAQQSGPNIQLTDTQKEGRRIFQQRCAVCHTPPTVVSKRYGPVLYKDIVIDNEDAIRETILEGRENLMPGFKYGMERSEVDAIIEYLKIVPRPRANNKRNSPDSGSGDR